MKELSKLIRYLLVAVVFVLLCIPRIDRYIDQVETTNAIAIEHFKIQRSYLQMEQFEFNRQYPEPKENKT